MIVTCANVTKLTSTTFTVQYFELSMVHTCDPSTLEAEAGGHKFKASLDYRSNSILGCVCTRILKSYQISDNSESSMITSCSYVATKLCEDILSHF